MLVGQHQKHRHSVNPKTILRLTTAETPRKRLPYFYRGFRWQGFSTPMRVHTGSARTKSRLFRLSCELDLCPTCEEPETLNRILFVCFKYSVERALCFSEARSAKSAVEHITSCVSPGGTGGRRRDLQLHLVRFSLKPETLHCVEVTISIVV